MITDISVLSGINSLQTIGCQSNSIVSIPSGFSQLSNLSSLNVAKNKLSGPLIDLASPKLNYLDISENYFRFIDIEPVFSKYSSFAAFSFRYAPQAKTDLAETINRGTGGSITLSMSDDGIHRYTDSDKFKWYKGA
ncbi:leucine-rich repeat domain-containing protein, partial [Flavobacterium circumlabens]